MILALKYPLIQLRPRFTGAAGSPFVATILPSFLAIIIPQPVPQNLQTALSHFHSSSCAPNTGLGTLRPATLAALAIAVFLIKSLLFIL